MTTRFDEAKGGAGNQRPTDKFDGQPDFNSLSLNKGDLVDDRFIIQETILTESGEADIFRCKDDHTGEDAVLKFYRIKYQPKEQVITEFLNLDHPDLVRVIKYGTWSGRFYEMMEYCAGGMLSNYVPLNVAAIRLLLPGIVNGLNYLHSKNIIHRDIKPDNFYFRRPNMQELVIGDFGISSLLEHDQHTHKTESQAWTVDYAAPEIFGNNIYTESDYYSLGITLIHLFLGVSPFKEGFVARDAIVAAHMRGDIPNIEKLPEDLQYVVSGLTQLKPSNRWGYGQVMQWLKGEKVLTDAGLPWQKDRYAGKEFPYPSYPAAKTPAELAAALDKFDAQNDLYRGRISAWVFNNFHDAEMSKRIEYIEENSGKKRGLGVIKLGFLLDSTLPLKISGIEVTCLEDLITLLKMKGANMGHDLKQALFDEYLECWIENTQEIVGGQKSRLLQDIASIRNRFINIPELGLFVLLYTLSPSSPLIIDVERNISIRRPEDLEEILSKDPSLIEKVFVLFNDRYLEEWLRIAFTGDGKRKAYAELLGKARTLYADDKALTAWVIRWIFSSTLGFPFGKEMVANPKELAKVIDQSAETKNTGIKLLQNGWVKAWLVHTRRISENDTSEFDNAIKEGKGNWVKILEDVLHFLDPSRPGPKVSVDKQSIDFGKILNDIKKTEALTIKNSGKGYLSGIIILQDNSRGITVDNKIIDGDTVTVNIIVNTVGLEKGNYESKIIIRTNGGDHHIPVSYKVVSSKIGLIAVLIIPVFLYTAYILTSWSGGLNNNNSNKVLNAPAVVAPLVVPKFNKKEAQKAIKKQQSTKSNKTQNQMRVDIGYGNSVDKVNTKKAKINEETSDMQDLEKEIVRQQKIRYKGSIGNDIDPSGL